MAIKNAYRSTDRFILENSMQLGPGGSTAVTAIVIDGKDLWVANVGDSRAVLCERGSANQLTVDHEPHTERKRIEKQGGFVTNLPGKSIFYSSATCFLYLKIRIYTVNPLFHLRLMHLLLSILFYFKVTDPCAQL